MYSVISSHFKCKSKCGKKDTKYLLNPLPQNPRQIKKIEEKSVVGPVAAPSQSEPSSYVSPPPESGDKDVSPEPISESVVAVSDAYFSPQEIQLAPDQTDDVISLANMHG